MPEDMAWKESRDTSDFWLSMHTAVRRRTTHHLIRVDCVIACAATHSRADGRVLDFHASDNRHLSKI